MFAKLTMFQKILLGFLITIVAIYTSFALVWSRTQSELEDNRSQIIHSQVDFTLHTVCNMFEQARSEQKNLVNNEYLNLLSQASYQTTSYSTIKNFNSLQKSLIDIKNKLDYISNIEIYIPSQQKVVTLASISPVKYWEYQDLITNKSKGIRYQSEENQFIINLYSNLFNSYDNDLITLPVFYIRFHISLDKIKSSMDDILPLNTRYIIRDVNNMEILFKNSLPVKNSEYIKTEYDKDYIEYTSQGLMFQMVRNDMIFQIEVPKEVIKSSKVQLRYGIVFLLFFLVASLLIFIVYTKKIIYALFQKMMNAFKTVEEGDFEHTLVYNQPDDFSFLYDAFNNMITKINTLIEEVYVQKINTQKAKLKQLQYQINPHFLYNTLSIVYRMIQFSDYDGAANMSRYLSNYYQYITRTGVEHVPLKKEYEHTKNYIQIQKVRFSESLEITLDSVPEDLEKLIVPRLILQPIVENAFKYGLKNMNFDGMIRITFHKSQGFLIIQVDDNGQNLDEEVLQGINQRLEYSNDEAAATGIVNVHRRIQIQFGSESGIKVSKNQWNGLCCAIYIKLEEKLCTEF